MIVSIRAPSRALAKLLGLALFTVAHANAFAQDLQWATSAGGTGVDQVSSVAVDGAGNSYVTGFFEGSATFGPGESNETVLASAGIRDIFVAMFDTNGALLWATRAGGTGVDFANSIGVDTAGNALVTGRFAGSATFGTGEPNETILVEVGETGEDTFIAKYANDGTLLWAKRAGGGGQRRRWRHRRRQRWQQLRDWILRDQCHVRPRRAQRGHALRKWGA